VFPSGKKWWEVVNLAEIQTPKLNPPQYHLPATVDDKGRLNTPAVAIAYFEGCGITDFFCTTLDERMALIYPMAVWLRNLEVFENARENAAAAKRMAFRARANGGEVKLDKSGRILLPSNLRAVIDIEKQPVWLEFHNGFIKVMTKPVYDAEKQSAAARAAEDQTILEGLGFIG
jgi:DNA-binding transcriptional regulator/RsmH inhibitor MraZ